MAKLTRNDVVARAYNIYPQCAYVKEGNGLFTGAKVQTSEGLKYTTDCSAFVAWCWGWSKRTDTGSLWNSSMCVKVKQSGQTIEDAFPGIIAGDALIRRSGDTGHTGIYVGNNTYIHAATSLWYKLPPCGVGIVHGVGTFMGYVKFDNTSSFDYDPAEEDPVTKPNPEWTHVPEQSPTYMNGDLDYNAYVRYLNRRYIRNYKRCKFMRKGGL